MNKRNFRNSVFEINVISKFKEVIYCFQLIFSIVFFFAAVSRNVAQENMREPVGDEPRMVRIEVLCIKPTHEEDYEGHFRFINNGDVPLEISSNWKTRNGRFWPTYSKYQILNDGHWEEVSWSCGEFLMPQEILPHTPYEFIVDLGPFERKNRPLTCRVGFEGGRFWTPPFVLDWESDTKTGKFLAANNDHIEALRSGLRRCGFQNELLKNPDFPRRLVSDMLNSIPANGGGDQWFGPYQGELKVKTNVRPDGSIGLGFSTGAARKNSFCYRGHIIINPKTLSAKWFQANRKNGISTRFISNGKPENDNFSKECLLKFEIGQDKQFESDNQFYYDVDGDADSLKVAIYNVSSYGLSQPFPSKLDAHKAAECAFDAFEQWFDLAK